MTNDVFNKMVFKSLFATSIREDENSYVVNEIFTKYDALTDLLSVTEEELLSIKGIGKVKAKQIVAALQLTKLNPTIATERYQVRGPKDVYDYLKDMQYLHREEFVVLGLNTKNEIIFKETIFKGSLNASIVHPRETFIPLIKRCCASAIIAHNHPSGNAEPSQEDIKVTKRLMEVGEVIGIEVLDHIIIGHEKFISLKENHYIY